MRRTVIAACIGAVSTGMLLMNATRLSTQCRNWLIATSIGMSVLLAAVSTDAQERRQVPLTPGPQLGPAGNSSPLLPSPGDNRSLPEIAPPPLPTLPAPTATGDQPGTGIFAISLADVPAWSQLMRGIVLESIPKSREETKHWGKTKKVFSGFNVRGTRISKRTKEVRHGSWRRHSIEFLKIEETFRFDIQILKQVAPGENQFEVLVVCRVRVETRFEQWTLGVKGLNFVTRSDSTIAMRAHCRIGVHAERASGGLLPEIVLDPEIQRVRIDLTDLDVRQLGFLGGDISDPLGDTSRWLVEDILQGQEGKILAKSRRVVEKNRDKLRLSPSSLW